jgi:hypothetical protein
MKVLGAAIAASFLFSVAQPAVASCVWKVVTDKSDGLGSNLLATSASAASDVWSAGVVNRAAGPIPMAERWNGKAWKLFTPSAPNGAGFQAVVDISPTVAYFAGFTSAGEFQNPLIEAWNGSTITTQAVTAPKKAVSILNGITSVSATDLWAVGSTQVPGKFGASYALFNGGNKWVRAVTPNVAGGSNSLTAVSGIAENYIWAVGTVATGPASDPVYSTLSEFWNGRKWIVIRSLNAPGAISSLLESVKVIAKNDVWAVGFSISQGTGFAPLAEHFNGSGWQIYTTPNVANSQLFSVAASGTGDVFAVGQSTTSIFSTLTEHWNGNAWSVVASPNESGGHGDFFAGVTFVPGTQDYWAVGAGVNSEDQYASALSEEYVCGTSDALPAFMHRALLRR